MTHDDERSEIEELGSYSESSMVDATISSGPLDRIPPVSIGFFILWTACSAVCISLVRSFLTTDEMPTPFIFTRIITAVNAVVSGAGLAGAILLVRPMWSFRDRLSAFHPGHWLLLAGGSLVVGQYIFFLSGQTQLTQNSVVPVLLYGVSILPPIVVNSAGCYWLQTTAWRGMLCLMITSQLLQCTAFVCLLLFSMSVTTSLLGISYVISVIAWFWLASLVAVDLKGSNRRDWLHWMGVLYFMVTPIIYAVWAVVISII